MNLEIISPLMSCKSSSRMAWFHKIAPCMLKEICAVLSEQTLYAHLVLGVVSLVAHQRAGAELFWKVKFLKHFFKITRNDSFQFCRR